MNIKKFRFQSPAGDGDAGGGADTDRGDDYTPPTEVPAVDPELAVAAAALAAEEAELKKLTKDVDKDVAEDSKDDEEEKKKTKDSRIPLARHKEIIDKLRGERDAALAETAKARNGQVIASTNEQITAAENSLLALEADYAKQITDGFHEKAAAIMKEIRTTERSIIESKAEMRTQVAESRAYERVRYDTTVERLEAAYPQLNPDDTETYDEEAMDTVMRLMRSYQRDDGMTPAAALQAAAKKALGAGNAKQASAVTVTPRVDPDDVAQKLTEERKKAAVGKAIDASGKQPPALKGVGADSDKAGGLLRAEDAIKMPYEDFMKISDKDLARMRGDEVGA